MSATDQDLTPQQIDALKRAILSGAVSPGLFGGDANAVGEGVMDAQLAVEGLPGEAADLSAIAGGAAVGTGIIYFVKRLQNR